MNRHFMLLIDTLNLSLRESVGELKLQTLLV
nr:MAG TPA: hypothetical protein [Caudoviricetes sp.]DAK07865.1 MAG TPA: hypothetical protein [Caudoviricetes sp.]